MKKEKVSIRKLQNVGNYNLLKMSRLRRLSAPKTSKKYITFIIYNKNSAIVRKNYRRGGALKRHNHKRANRIFSIFSQFKLFKITLKFKITKF